jgi:hypothetical protein
MAFFAHTPRPLLRRSLGPIVLAVSALLFNGCSTNAVPDPVNLKPASGSYNGKVFGGQNPVSGSKVYLYAAGGASGGSRSMLKAPGYVTTDQLGGFSIANDFTCTAGDQVYMLALGGDAGGGSNSAIGLMSALGPCSGITTSSFIEINEVTTVATAFALSSYITSPTAVGADPVGSNAVAAAFANTKALADTGTGVSPATVIGSGVVPQATVNSLANSLAACINSATSSSTCSSLFTDTGAPQDSTTAQAAINIAHTPASNVAAIYNLADAQPPFSPNLHTAPTSWAIQTTFPADVLTYHNDISRSGVQSAETILTPANVNSSTFGKRFSFPVDGQLYAGPLFTGGLGMPDGNLHDVVFAATANGTVYAFDADGNNPSAGYLWKQSLFASGEVAVQETDTGCTDTTPLAGLLGTPVIDRSTGTLYVVTMEKITASGLFTQKLHAINLIDGTEKFNGPTVITATYNGTGDGAVVPSGGTTSQLTFAPIMQNQRPALLLVNGTVWISWASHCDYTRYKGNLLGYHGYVMGYSASDVSHQTAVFNNTPNGSDGGIWMSGGGPTADAAGNVYVVGGNGTFDVNTGGSDYGDSSVKLTPPTGSNTIPTVADYFTPSNQLTLSNGDHDVGVTNALLFNDPGSKVPHLMVQTDKTGRIYLLNTDNMGRYDGPNGANPDLQDWAIGNDIFNNFSYFNKTLYVGGSSLPLRAYPFTSGSSSHAGSFNANYSSRSPTTPGGSYASGGACPVVSANGTASAIVWIQEHTGVSGAAAAMRAYDATNLATELYNTNQAASNRDKISTPLKFTCPVVANGTVFVPGAVALDVYGLLP